MTETPNCQTLTHSLSYIHILICHMYGQSCRLSCVHAKCSRHLEYSTSTYCTFPWTPVPVDLLVLVHSTDGIRVSAAAKDSHKSPARQSPLVVPVPRLTCEFLLIHIHTFAMIIEYLYYNTHILYTYINMNRYMYHTGATTHYSIVRLSTRHTITLLEFIIRGFTDGIDILYFLPLLLLSIFPLCILFDTSNMRSDSYSSALESSSLTESHRSMQSINGSINGNSYSSSRKKPNPLKQRTSSIDTRKDYSYVSTWWSLRDLIKTREWFITVNNFPIWRRHLAWAMENGADLRNYMTSRYASSMVFLSLLLAAELNILFDSAAITTDIRQAMKNQAHFKLQFWIGLMILVSILLTLLSLITTYTAWGIVSAISDENAHCILRSSIGQYVGELPHRFIVASIYAFLFWIVLIIFLLLPVGFWSMLLVLLVTGLFVHVMMAFSSFGRLILHTTAMSPNRIFEEGYEKSLTPQPLQEQLYIRAKAEIGNDTSITRQYRRKLEPLGRMYGQDELAAVLRSERDRQPMDSPAYIMGKVYGDNNRERVGSTADNGAGRMRTDSTVRFADQLLVMSSTGGSYSDMPRERLLTPTAEISSVASSGQQSPPNADSGTFNSSARSPYHFSKEGEPLPAPPPPPGGFTSDSLQGWLASNGLTPTGSQTHVTNVSSIPPPPKLVIGLGQRSYSAVSSVDDELDANSPYQAAGHDSKYGMTDDEKFDLDYGDVNFSYQDEVEQNGEATRLLGEIRTTYHSSMTKDNGQPKR